MHCGSITLHETALSGSGVRAVSVGLDITQLVTSDTGVALRFFSWGPVDPITFLIVKIKGSMLKFLGSNLDPITPPIVIN